MSNPWEELRYPARLTNVVDGAVLDFELDFGFDMRFIQRFRLDKVNVWGLGAPPGENRNTAFAAKGFVQQELEDAKVIKVHSCRKENDIYFADIFYKKSGDKKWRDLGKALLREDLASPKNAKAVKKSALVKVRADAS